MHPRRARTRMDSAKECLEEVGRGRDAGPPAGCGQAQPTLGTSESDRGVYLVILLVYLQQKKEEGLHQFSTPDVLSGGPPSWDLEHRGLCFGCDLFIRIFFFFSRTILERGSERTTGPASTVSRGNN